MTDINILHFSDLHVGSSGHDFFWGNVEQALFSDLEKVTKYAGKWDLLFITGDLVFSGSEAEYKELNNKLKRVYKKLNDLGSNPFLVPVPGNHDLLRPGKDEPIVEVIKDWNAKPYLHKDFWSNHNNKYREFLSHLFVNYSNWLQTHPFPKLLNYKLGMLPGDFAGTYTKNDVIVGLVGLNTSFLHISDDSQGKLDMHPLQFQACVGRYPIDWLNSHHFSLLLTHHPPDWLSKTGLSAFNGEIAISGRFAFHFTGHLHENLQRSESINGAATKHHLQGSSVFGLKSYGKSNEQRIHGYCGVQFKVENDEANVKLWPRTSSGCSSQPIKLVPDTKFILKEDRYAVIEPPVKVNIITTPTNSAKRPFTVLLLSSSIDLAKYREDTAAYLQCTLGIEVVHADENSETNPSVFDFSILLQGWYWNSGKLPEIWLKAKEENRLLFFPDEHADWPPKRLVEKGKEVDVEVFIKNHNYVPFNSPDELPEKVGVIVVEQVGQYLDEQVIGLLGFERAYLSFRLPTWIAGRSASSNAHLFNCEDTEDLYQPELYVQLDAYSKNFILDDKLQIKRTDKTTALEDTETLTRGQMGYWISFPEMKRVGIVGAPGGGKTIFLTRLAADLGNACVGRRVNLASGIDREKFRNPAGAIPIPILIEATKLAKVCDLGISGILHTLTEELTVTGHEISDDLVNEGLKAGKYVLLIDALDEISNFQLRKRVLLNLKGLCGPDCYPETRLIITTRSAR